MLPMAKGEVRRMNVLVSTRTVTVVRRACCRVVLVCRVGRLGTAARHFTVRQLSTSITAPGRVE